MNSDKKKVIIYIDGNNFYFSIKKTFNQKIDIEKFCKKLAKKYKLVKINYYISPVGESNPKMYAEQQRFFEKIRKIEKLKIIFGRLEKHKKDNKTFYIEKATDINIAQDLIFDAINNNYDKAFLISNDGDFSSVISSIINRLNKKIIYVAIGNKKSISYHLKKVASSTQIINTEFIKDLTNFSASKS
ncbi:MAG: NYN domain-containing protein [archaeon]